MVVEGSGISFNNLTTMNNMETLQFNNINIRVDEHERVNMTDLWKASGKAEEYKPYRWIKYEGSEFINAVTNKLKGHVTPLLETKRGRTGGTFGHKQIALAYAKYLSPELHMYVNQVFFERLEEEANPELGITRSHERAIESWTNQGKSPVWIEQRSLHGYAWSVFVDAVKGSPKVGHSMS